MVPQQSSSPLLPLLFQASFTTEMRPLPLGCGATSGKSSLLRRDPGVVKASPGGRSL